MLCLKTEVLHDDLDNNQPSNANAETGSAATSGGFVLPINLGGSIHKYLWRIGKVTTTPLSSTRSVSSGDGSPTFSDLEDARTRYKRGGKMKGEDSSFYKHQLEQEVKKLQQQLQEEISVHLALASAVEHSDSSLSNSPCQLPDKAQELLDSIAILEITVSKLEQESVALQYQLSQERNERRLAEYHLRHLPYPASSPFDCSQFNFTEMSMRTCSMEKAEGRVEDNALLPDVIREPDKDHFVEKLYSSKLSSPECLASPSSPQGHLSYSSLASFSDSPIKNSLIKSPPDDMEHGLEVSARYCKLDPYRVPGKLDWTESIGTYSNAVEVSWLSVGQKELEYASGALKRFRLLVEQLAEVDPSCLSCNEKLAFWINVYNALIMHAFLAYGVPKSEIKLFSLMQKAAYIIGGHSISAADIEYNILKMKPPAHRPQIALVLALQKFKITEEQKRFSIDEPEPLLAFALSSGMHSSPAVRIFRPENVNELLQNSLKEYVQASVGISNKGKLLVPKLLYCFAKGIVEDLLLPEWICQFLSPEQAVVVRDRLSNHKWSLLGARSFSILPFDSRFRFLFLL
ncbi:hypothetical protein OIU79_011754 [Salix purpurea]|uniref:DUF547 domain-containing protein n=1 Tax=Salix purpurea TaxID=77065 RepID=A0A9Q0Q224_SALPP|nr:hypothetical protein OIU79_011754 [Salix purpurea]